MNQTDCPLCVQVLTALDKEERRLFHDRLRYLDKRITPGVNKLAWISPKATLDFFYKEACTYAHALAFNLINQWLAHPCHRP